ncbi:response regulator [Leucobacter ruminantium]|uniref:Response regulator transcription factor n=1 Tax=Leucobacter ruminantium TaxID=1289170 RepID=A0A939LYL8_9MICO|nr:response regulator transcription factor [Leucobacter ruminantium]MBO1806521.1 response regulator transcription factor [Leucobacter ruminantium]
MPQPAPLRIGLLEDQPLFREMLQHLLGSVPGLRVSPAADCAQALTGWNARELDVVLLDVELPDGSGLDVGRELQRTNPELGIVLLSAIDRSRVLLELDESERARWSYLSKRSSTSASTLVRALRATAAGRCVVDPSVIAGKGARAGSRLASLSERQRQVLDLLAEGLTNQAIATQLGIALNSVSNHVNAIYAQLDIDREQLNPRVAAVRILLEESV